ncbi:MAG: hypothetical protein IKO46_04470 [Salinivirgaceae bacterium]|nr:hypothetical protein [Salinivirgaceae bacterium]
MFQILVFLEKKEMSESVEILTKKKIVPDDFFNALVKLGERFCVTSNEFPCLKFGTLYKSLRGVEVNQEDDGYEVRICSFSTYDDYRLFRVSIDVMKELTGGKVSYLEEIIDSSDYFDDKWIESEMDAGISTVTVLARHENETITLYGMFAPFCFGPKMLDFFGLSDGHMPDKSEMCSIRKYFCDMQWSLEDKVGTQSDLMVKGENGEIDKAVSLITIKNGKVSKFDYISYAPMVAVGDLDNDNVALLDFEKFKEIVPQDKVEYLDECQMLVKIPFTVEDVLRMIDFGKQ